VVYILNWRIQPVFGSVNSMPGHIYNRASFLSYVVFLQNEVRNNSWRPSPVVIMRSLLTEEGLFMAGQIPGNLRFFSSRLAHSIDSNRYSIGAINVQSAPKGSRYFPKLTVAISACLYELTTYEFLALWHIICWMLAMAADASKQVCQSLWDLGLAR
jgi:hypothetical protein